MTPKIAIWILAIVYTVGIVGLIIPDSRALFTGLTPYTLLLSFFILLFFNKKWDAGFFMALVLISLSGFFIEYIGVQTGMIFGRYTYGSGLGYKWNGIPLLIGINWFFMVYCSRALAQKITSNTFLSVFLAALFMTGYDYLLEPFAVQFDLWKWNAGVIPLQNVFGWLVVSLLLHFAYQSSTKQVANKLAIPIFVIHLLFFIVLGLYFKTLPYTPAY